MSDSLDPTSENPLAAIYRCYASLAATLPLHPESGLGGKLLYAGEIDDASRNCLYAANIAGAASLAASADPAVLRHAMREGVIDFLVNSLEEALRILKNEIRKHQTVCVGVGVAPEILVDQMLDRGVLPDLLPPDWDEEQKAKFRGQGARTLVQSTAEEEGHFVTWGLEKNFAIWMPRLDACALAVLPEDDFLRRRWLALAPRYLGRLAQRRHGAVLRDDEMARFKTGIQQLLSQHESASGPVPEVTISG